MVQFEQICYVEIQYILTVLSYSLAHMIEQLTVTFSIAVVASALTDEYSNHQEHHMDWLEWHV